MNMGIVAMKYYEKQYDEKSVQQVLKESIPWILSQLYEFLKPNFLLDSHPRCA